MNAKDNLSSSGLAAHSAATLVTKRLRLSVSENLGVHFPRRPGFAYHYG